MCGAEVPRTNMSASAQRLLQSDDQLTSSLHGPLRSSRRRSSCPVYCSDRTEARLITEGHVSSCIRSKALTEMTAPSRPSGPYATTIKTHSQCRKRQKHEKQENLASDKSEDAESNLITRRRSGGAEDAGS